MLPLIVIVSERRFQWGSHQRVWLRNEKVSWKPFCSLFLDCSPDTLEVDFFENAKDNVLESIYFGPVKSQYTKHIWNCYILGSLNSGGIRNERSQKLRKTKTKENLILSPYFQTFFYKLHSFSIPSIQFSLYCAAAQCRRQYIVNHLECDLIPVILFVGGATLLN